MENKCGVNNKVIIDNFIKNSKKGKLKYSLREIKDLDYTNVGVSISDSWDGIRIDFTHKFFERSIDGEGYRIYTEYILNKSLNYSLEIIDNNTVYVGYGDIVVDLSHDRLVPLSSPDFYDDKHRSWLEDIWNDCCNQDEQYYLHFGYNLPYSLNNICLEVMWDFIVNELITLIDFRYEKELDTHLDSIVRNIYNNFLHKVKFFKGVELDGSYNISILWDLLEINFDVNKQIISVLRLGDTYTMWYDAIYSQEDRYFDMQEKLYNSDENEYYEFKFSEILEGNFEYNHLDRVKLIEFVETINYLKSILN